MLSRAKSVLHNTRTPNTQTPCSDVLSLYYIIPKHSIHEKKNSRKQSSINNSNQHYSRRYKLVEVNTTNYDYCSMMLTISFICSQLSPHKTLPAQPLFNQGSTSTPLVIATHHDSDTYEDIQPIRSLKLKVSKIFF